MRRMKEERIELNASRRLNVEAKVEEREM